ncbi:mCG1030806, partial [Mus musculus]
PFVGRSDSCGLVCSDIWTLLLFETRQSRQVRKSLQSKKKVCRKMKRA